MSPLEPRPLAGKRVVVTRAADQAQSMVDDLGERGAEPLLMPGIVSAGLFAFLLSWGNFPLSLFTTGADQTVPEWLYAKMVSGYTPMVPTLGTLTRPPPIFVSVRTRLAARNARGNTCRRCTPTVPADCATSKASFTWPRIWGSPTTIESKLEATRKMWRTASRSA